MPVCPGCGQRFSGFSLGSKVATECRQCRKTKAQAQVSAVADASVIAAPKQRAARRGPLPVVTLTLIGLNVLVYAAMGLSGVSWTEPSVEHAIRWGADFGPLTLSGQWWRLFTSTFVHFGIVHIGLNMWCLLDLGLVLEPLMGRRKFGVMYVASGLAASLVSVAWNPWRVSAGASGAIFGVAGAFVAYLALKKTSFDPHLARKNLKSMAFFIGYNLLRGLGGAVDNSAHLGGLLAGLILGVVIPPAAVFAAGGAGPAVFGTGTGNDAGSEYSENRSAWTVGACSAALLILAGMGVYAKNIPVALYGKAVRFVQAGRLNEGAAEMAKAVALDPNLLLAQALLGEWRLEQNDPNAAVPALQKALELAPQSSFLRHNLALAHLGSGESRPAIAEIVQALGDEKADPWRGEFILGMAREENGDYGPASVNLRSVIQSKPDFYEALTVLARVEAGQGKIDEARTLYGQVLKANPRDPVALSDTSFLAAGGTARPAPGQLAPLAIPYAKLAMKSQNWPLFP